MKAEDTQNRPQTKNELNWRQVWQRKRKERVEVSCKGKSMAEDWDKVAQDYSEEIKSNDYEYGRKAIDAIQEIVAPDFEALDIGAGPGTLAIPLAKKVRRMTVIEPSKEMVRYLMRNAEEEGIENIEVINKNWQEVSDPDMRKKFDIAACSHLLWQFKDVNRQLRRMEVASKRYCCVVHPAGGRDIIIRSLWSEATGKRYSGEVDPDLDDILFVMLRQRGILVNVKVIDYTIRRTLEQEERHIESLLGRYTEITPALKDIIRRRIIKKSRNGMYERKSNAVVMWWKTPYYLS